MKAWRLFFLGAGLFNVVGGLAGFFTFQDHLTSAGLPTPLYNHSFQLLFIFVVVLGIGYLMVWQDPVRHRGIVWLGLLSKAAGFVVSLYALRIGELPASGAWQPWVVDFPFLVAFAVFLVQTRTAEPPREPAHLKRH